MGFKLKILLAKFIFEPLRIMKELRWIKAIKLIDQPTHSYQMILKNLLTS